MEHIKRENLLFESYLIRNSANFNMKEEEQEAGKKGGKGKKKNELKGLKLNPDEKYEIANLESEALKKNIEDGRIRSDSILETLRVCYKNIILILGYIRRNRYGNYRD
jgi:hypothetical protein